MEIRTELNYLRIAPRKVRLVADAIRGKRVPEAEVTLRFLARRAAEPMAKLLKAAVADAKENFQVAKPEALVITRIMVDGGPTLKRSRPRAMGRAFAIRKHTSHITLILESREPASAKRRRRKADVTVAGGGVTSGAEPPHPDGSARMADGRSASPKLPRGEQSAEMFRQRSKVVTKPTGFVQRMFRRKAI